MFVSAILFADRSTRSKIGPIGQGPPSHLVKKKKKEGDIGGETVGTTLIDGKRIICAATCMKRICICICIWLTPPTPN